ncbi:solute carrier organic anion transporter family member [Plakobranchus ocellatus]|uniref:Solute carrier organic anion transporter family member n=1 Tax=Plakobranchus ocellatus TaxID=259542 RepID=A0AAV4B2Z4_9GAST|nr:solute carrier organic anion transporter family member [Plakobranchus ocellatus]
MNTFTMALGISGTMSFQMKYIENQYDMPAYKISLYLGIGMLVTVLVGVFMGGALITRFKLGVLGMFHVTVIGEFLALVCSIVFLFLGCPNHQVVGFNQDLGNVSDIGCQCFSQVMLVVCGEDGRNYLSPCLAGCTQSEGLSFTQCAYVGGKGTAVPGFCQNCDLFPAYITLVTLMAVSMMVTFTPHVLMVARLVPLRDQPNVTSLAYGVLTVGMLVGPIIFGHIYDSTCSLWSPFGEMCAVPDKKALRNIFLVSDVGIRVGGFILLVIATIVVHCTKDALEHDNTLEMSFQVDKLAPKNSEADGCGDKKLNKIRGSRKNQEAVKGKCKKEPEVSYANNRMWRETGGYLGDYENAGSMCGDYDKSRRKNSRSSFADHTLGRVSVNGLTTACPAEDTKHLNNDVSDENANVKSYRKLSAAAKAANGYSHGINKDYENDDLIDANVNNDRTKESKGHHSYDNNCYIPEDAGSPDNVDVKNKGIDKLLSNNSGTDGYQQDNDNEEFDVSEDDIGAMFAIEDYQKTDDDNNIGYK